MSEATYVSSGVGFGAALAMVVSHAHNANIGWAILHGLCSWFYIIYALIVF